MSEIETTNDKKEVEELQFSKIKNMGVVYGCTRSKLEIARFRKSKKT
jgi:hypothetical protein